MNVIASTRIIVSSLILGLCLPMSANASPGSNMEALLQLDLKSLTQLTVRTVNNIEEMKRDAPAMTIILNREELLSRGYQDLSQIYDDLPGMDVIRPSGDVYFANYWRGVRNNLGSPYLLLLDGVIQNDLYYNATESILSMPINSVEKIEIVYGPASVIYGANAFTGVVNVITRHSDMTLGTYSEGTLRVGENSSRIADLFAGVGNESVRATLAARYDEGFVDDRFTNDYEWTNDRYYRDAALWGGFLQNPDYGRYKSPHRNSGVDARLAYEDTELALQQFIIDRGYGSEYPADITQNNASVKMIHRSLNLVHQRDWNDALSSKTLLRHRTGDMHDSTDFLEGFNRTNDSGESERVINYSFWEITNESNTFQHELAWTLSPQWRINGGVEIEEKDLQKAAQVAYGPTLLPNEVNLNTYPEASALSNEPIANNRFNTLERSAYSVVTYRVPDAILSQGTHILNAGIRLDDHSIFGSQSTIRGGYVSHFGDLTLRLLMVGDAYQEPTPRVLYSGWEGSGSNPELKPETATTSEINMEYFVGRFSSAISLYRMKTQNIITNDAGSATNTGANTINGADLHLKGPISLSGNSALMLWSYYSYLDTAMTESDMDAPLDASIGDTARHKWHLGITWPWSDQWELSVRSRYIGSRKTIDSNPVGKVGSYTTLDSNLRYQLRGDPRFTFNLTIDNLFNRRYFHPGVRQANAGTTPGFFEATPSDDNAEWNGSDGYFSSLLPQAGRLISGSVQWEF